MYNVEYFGLAVFHAGHVIGNEVRLRARDGAGDAKELADVTTIQCVASPLH